jgi:hypothetical protein
MSCPPSHKELLAMSQALKQAELVARNKILAREQLLRIQLMLSKRTQ